MEEGSECGWAGLDFITVHSVKESRVALGVTEGYDQRPVQRAGPYSPDHPITADDVLSHMREDFHR
jgi:hypothetical protein